MICICSRPECGFDAHHISELPTPACAPHLAGRPYRAKLRAVVCRCSEAASRPVRVGARGDVRDLRPGEQAVFELSQNPATTGPAARDRKKAADAGCVSGAASSE
jgi:hypothetical protein